MNIVVLSRSQAIRFDSSVPWIAIQIAEQLNDLPRLNQCQLRECLQLAFADADRPFFAGEGSSLNIDAGELFSEEQANRILDFIEKNRSTETLLIHCYAGISRSPAVAAALSKLWHDDDFRWFEKPYTPNMLVYRVLLTEGMKRK